MNDKKTKCGFVAVIGEPNSGKSTLVNRIVGEKVSIVSHRVQTTRHRIRAVSQHDDCHTQIVFVDTPGFFNNAKTDLEKALMTNFKHAYKDSDVILVMIDACCRNILATLSFLEKLKNRKVAAVINKVDIADKSKILKIANELSKFDFLEKVFMISASNGDGVSAVVEYLKDNMSEGPYMFDPNSKTDMSMQFRLSEITREKLYQVLLAELPYSIYVETELFKETEKKAKIYQSIVVAKDSQKGIVLGSGGDRIKSIKDMAISDIKDLLCKKIELKLFVKVKENWTKKRTHLQNAGIVNH
ncbi:MAG: GTPase Era [Holosporales bacterium]|jgi:GTP-binding protein Era|nr:GTPase Era [Holosporales bacterium]